MPTAHLTLLDYADHTRMFWIQLAETAGWDVRTEHGTGGELVAHFEDWHRLERTMTRLGIHMFAIDTGASEL